MKAAVCATVGFWLGVAVALLVAAIINGCDSAPSSCTQVISGAGIHIVCAETPVPVWRIKRTKCKGKWGRTFCTTQWTFTLPTPEMDRG